MTGSDAITDASLFRPSFFRRVASRPYRPNRDEREDRFTEILAAVLDHPTCASLGTYLARGWLDLAAQGGAGIPKERGVELRGQLATAFAAVHIATQTPITNGARRLDLTLVFKLPANAELTICVEAKIDAGPERDQLRDYCEWVNSRPGRGLVILAAPRSRYASFGPGQLPSEVGQIPWETTAALLKEYGASSDAETWMVNELLAYMSEEDLVDPDKLETRHIDSLVLNGDAWKALSRVLDAADAYLHQHWGPKLDGNEDSTERWGEYPSGLDSGPGTLGDDVPGFTWDMLYDGGKWFPDRRRGVPIFTAGIFRRSWMSAESDRTLGEHGFDLFSRESGTWRGSAQPRVYRRADIDAHELALVRYATLEEQGNALGAWIKQAFEDLHKALSAPAMQQEFIG